MKKLLNTLYVTTADSYLSLDGETVVVLNQDKVLGRIPLHNLEGIIACGYTGASPALMGKCAKRNISLCFLKPNGSFLARVTGEVYGNVTLRKEQYRISDNPDLACKIAKNFIIGKVFNARWVIERVTREHALSVDYAKLKKVSAHLQSLIEFIKDCTSNKEELRPVMADRFVFSLINKRIINGDGFTIRENCSVEMSDEVRKTVITQWQNKRQEKISHPFLEEKIEWGLVPYVQALLLARTIRKDLDAYPPFMWK